MMVLMLNILDINIYSMNFPCYCSLGKLKQSINGTLGDEKVVLY